MEKHRTKSRQELEDDFEVFISQETQDDEEGGEDEGDEEGGEDEGDEEVEVENKRGPLMKTKLPNWYKSFGWKIDLLIIAAVMVYLLKG